MLKLTKKKFFKKAHLNAHSTYTRKEKEQNLKFDIEHPLGFTQSQLHQCINLSETLEVTNFAICAESCDA